MTNQEILDKAPEGATHFEDEFEFYKVTDYEIYYYYNNKWVGLYEPVVMRSLADIKRIVELEKSNDD